MTREEAVLEARRRWGERGIALLGYDLTPMTYYVGVQLPQPNAEGNYAEYFGSGLSFEEAFEQASRLLARKKVLAALNSRCLANELFEAMMDPGLPEGDADLVHQAARNTRGDSASMVTTLSQQWGLALHG